MLKPSRTCVLVILGVGLYVGGCKDRSGDAQGQYAEWLHGAALAWNASQAEAEWRHLLQGLGSANSAIAAHERAAAEHIMARGYLMEGAFADASRLALAAATSYPPGACDRRTLIYLAALAGDDQWIMSIGSSDSDDDNVFREASLLAARREYVKCLHFLANRMSRYESGSHNESFRCWMFLLWCTAFNRCSQAPAQVPSGLGDWHPRSLTGDEVLRGLPAYACMEKARYERQKGRFAEALELLHCARMLVGSVRCSRSEEVFVGVLDREVAEILAENRKLNSEVQGQVKSQGQIPQLGEKDGSRD